MKDSIMKLFSFPQLLLLLFLYFYYEISLLLFYSNDKHCWVCMSVCVIFLGLNGRYVTSYQYFFSLLYFGAASISQNSIVHTYSMLLLMLFVRFFLLLLYCSENVIGFTIKLRPYNFCLCNMLLERRRRRKVSCRCDTTSRPHYYDIHSWQSK